MRDTLRRFAPGAWIGMVAMRTLGSAESSISAGVRSVFGFSPSAIKLDDARPTTEASFDVSAASSTGTAIAFS